MVATRLPYNTAMANVNPQLWCHDQLKIPTYCIHLLL